MNNYVISIYIRQVHPTHNLPNGYNFTNFNNGLLAKAVRPVNDDDELYGPVHWHYINCHNSTYFFKVAYFGKLLY